jgi:hypothetical protein
MWKSQYVVIIASWSRGNGIATFNIPICRDSQFANKKARTFHSTGLQSLYSHHSNRNRGRVELHTGVRGEPQ